MSVLAFKTNHGQGEGGIMNSECRDCGYCFIANLTVGGERLLCYANHIEGEADDITDVTYCDQSEDCCSYKIREES